MEIQELINYLRKPSLDKAIYFSRKKRDSYVSYSPEVTGTILNEIIENAISYLEKRRDEEQIEFNPTGYREGTLEYCSYEYVGNYSEVIESFDPEIVEGIEDEVDNLNFYCIDIVDDNNVNLKLFRRVTKFKRLYSKGIIAAFCGNQLNKVESKMLGLDSEIDLIAYNDQLLVLNHISLERIFRLDEQYMVKAQEAIDFLKNTRKIANFDQFEEDSLGDLSVRKVLTKMLREGNDLTTCFDNFDNVQETIDLFDLEIEISRYPELELVYEDKRQIMDILRLARDSYYRSLIREQPGIDNKI